MNENKIRDLLANDLSVLEPDLQLLEIEKFIPSTLGTRSFLDILAKDRAGHWVIIEVKKTNAAAREAAHEVLKYVEAVQQHFGARNDEIRAIIASVEWKELLVPFSRFRKETTISIDGVQLVIDDLRGNLQVVPVEPVLVNQGRYLAPWHELNLYHDESNLERGVVSYDECCKTKGIDDYVMVVLRVPDDFYERKEFKIFDLEQFEYILYFAPQILTKEFCLSVLAREPEVLKEVIDYTESMNEEAELCVLHENAYDVDPRPFRDYFEIGYAAKFAQKLLNDEGWIVERVLRRGKFERNSLLSDDSIIEELKGWTGSSGQSLNRSISLSNPAHVSSARDGLASALSKNPAWLTQLNRVLDEILADMPDGHAKIYVFNPSSAVFTLYFMAVEEDSLSYMPQYEVVVKDAAGETCSVYFGLLAPSGEPMGFDEILCKYYDGQMRALMFLACAGFYEKRDADILDDLGLFYRTFRLEDPNGDQKWFELRDDRWRSFSPTIPFQPLQPYFAKQTSLIGQIVDAIGPRMHGGFHDMS